MINFKSRFLWPAAFLTALLAAYFMTIELSLDFESNLFSPLNAFAAAGILLFSYRKTAPGRKARITYLLYAFGIAAWGIADIIWGVLTLWGKDPMESPAVWVVYVLTNCLILAALAVFSVFQYQKWSSIQLSVDVFFISAMTLLFFWIVFLDKNVSTLIVLLQMDFTSLLSILTDVAILIGVLSWYLSIRSGKIPVSIRIMSIGSALFALTDIFYYYVDFKGYYLPNSPVDFAYSLSLYLLAIGAWWRVCQAPGEYDLTANTNAGSYKKWFYLLLYPLTLLIADATGWVKIVLMPTDLILYAALIFFYWIACRYIQFSIEREAFLTHTNELLEQRVAEQVRELQRLADQDTLTSLFNRRYFMNRLEERIRSIQPGETIALLMIDLDRFKTINDTYGHHVGDQVLVALSARLAARNSCGAVLARLGGDEFAILITGAYTKEDIEAYCRQAIHLCSGPIQAGERVLEITLSIGIAFSTGETPNGLTMLKHADSAMYRSKAQGRNQYLFYDPRFDRDMHLTDPAEPRARRAEGGKNFELVYQPQFSLPEKQLVGAEALIRCRTSGRGDLPPNGFSPIAKKIDDILKQGRQMMQESIRQASLWSRNRPDSLPVDISLSPEQLADEAFLSILLILAETAHRNSSGPDPERSGSSREEIGETASQVLNALNRLGLSVSTDGVSPGEPELGFLRKYPFVRIKIDQSLVEAISSRNRGGIGILETIISSAKATGIQTIAEGVETQEQLDILTELGCDQAQGHLLGKPVPVDVFEHRFLKLQA